MSPPSALGASDHRSFATTRRGQCSSRPAVPCTTPTSVPCPGLAGRRQGLCRPERPEGCVAGLAVPCATYRGEVVKAVALGERVLLLYYSFGRLEGSTVEVKDELASVWTVRDGKITCVEFYATTNAEASTPWALRGRRCRRRVHDAVGVTLDGCNGRDWACDPREVSAYF
jgi:hypothetical protein